jgi:hypothetical protein
MRYSRCVLKPVILTGLLPFVLARDARPYIDPGVGSYVLQLARTAPFGGGVAFNVYCRRTLCSSPFSRGEEM